jgi:Lipase (class 3)
MLRHEAPLTMLACAIAVVALVLHHHDYSFVAEAVELLPRKIMDLAKLTADITEQINADDFTTPCQGCTDFQVFTTTKKWAVVTRTSTDYCLAVFKDTGSTSDWAENLNPGVAVHCDEDGNGKTICCKMRKGFKIAYSYLQTQVEDALRTCADSCIDPDECVVLGGYSLGGAVGNVTRSG